MTWKVTCLQRFSCVFHLTSRSHRLIKSIYLIELGFWQIVITIRLCFRLATVIRIEGKFSKARVIDSLIKESMARVVQMTGWIGIGLSWVKDGS